MSNLLVNYLLIMYLHTFEFALFNAIKMQLLGNKIELKTFLTNK